MEQFLLDMAAQGAAGVIVALFVYWLNRRNKFAPVGAGIFYRGGTLEIVYSGGLPHGAGFAHPAPFS